MSILGLFVNCPSNQMDCVYIFSGIQFLWTLDGSPLVWIQSLIILYRIWRTEDNNSWICLICGSLFCLLLGNLPALLW